MLMVKNKKSIEGFPRVCDLESGQLFTFLDDDEILMKIDFDYWYVNLETGEATDGEECDRPIRKIFGELTITG